MKRHLTIAQQTAPTAFVTIHRIRPCRNDTELVTGYAWNTDALTRQAFREARERFEVPFAHAD
ncbi:MAG: hypothetical protein EOM20_18855, partial [Spartobacteria bacterium]|nr:hypothetical protein [Spartobacteria bacterium]